MPLGQTAIFTFNVTGIGILGGTSFETNIDNIPANWTAVFEPKSFIAEKDDNFEIKLNITPGEGVVPDVFNDFNIDISWTDSKNNDIDDINHKFSLRVTPIERPKPDFIIDDFTWTPVAPLAGSELIFTAVIDDSVNKSGSHFVPVVFYVDDEAIGLTTAILNGSGEKITVTAIWKAKEGSHSFQVKIDPENSIDEKSIDNNEGELFIVSVAAKEVDANNSTLKIAATVVIFMVAGLAYISYRSRRS